MSDMRYRHRSRLILGLLVITLGVVFTLDNLGLVDAQDMLYWWPVLLVAYGLTRLTGVTGRQSTWTGAIFTVAGTWMLLYKAGLVHWYIWDFWPLILIVWGIALIRGRSRMTIGVMMRRRARAAAEAGQAFPGDSGPGGHPDTRDPNAAVKEETSGSFSVDVLMASVSRKVTAQDFTGGHVFAVMGGADIDLRQARMVTGQADLEVHLLMGGVNLIIPEDWAVDFDGAPIMGSVEDHSRPPAGEPRGRLRVHGGVIMSSVIIKN
jgi:predicted membrane protein